MPGLLDLLYVALLAVALPLFDYLVYWPAFRRRSQADPTRARRRLWVETIVGQWALVAIGATLWISNDRSWTALGFTVPGGWRLWASIVLFVLLVAYTVYSVVAVVHSPEARSSARKQVEQLADVVAPHTRTELYWFGGLSLTAGFCEEFLFRGYLIWALAPWLGWWGAAALSVLIFAFSHAYQGWNGIVRTGIVGALFTMFVGILESLWPAIVLHALVDLGSGLIAWLALREGQVTNPTTPREHNGQPTKPG